MSRKPLLLLNVPGLGNSGPLHWQTAWEHELRNCRRIELGCWDDSIRNLWISRLDQGVHDMRADVILIAHSLGCHAVAWWSHLLGSSGLSTIRGALLVAPPDVDRPDADPRLRRFAPSPARRLPFPTLLVASRDDPYARFERARALALQWGALFVDAGERGHINADSGVGSWAEGQALLQALIDTTGGARATLAERVARAVPGLRAEPAGRPLSGGRSR